MAAVMARSGSRSPRRTDAQEDETELEDAEPALGPDSVPVDFKGRNRLIAKVRQHLHQGRLQPVCLLKLRRF